MESQPNKLTLNFWRGELLTDTYWMQCMAMSHKGKDVEEAINQAFSFWVSDPDRLKDMEIRTFKQKVVTSLSFMRREKTKKEALQSHSEWLKANIR